MDLTNENILLAMAEEDEDGSGSVEAPEEIWSKELDELMQDIEDAKGDFDDAVAALIPLEAALATANRQLSEYPAGTTAAQRTEAIATARAARDEGVADRNEALAEWNAAVVALRAAIVAEINGAAGTYMSGGYSVTTAITAPTFSAATVANAADRMAALDLSEVTVAFTVARTFGKGNKAIVDSATSTAPNRRTFDVDFEAGSDDGSDTCECGNSECTGSCEDSTEIPGTPVITIDTPPQAATVTFGAITGNLTVAATATLEATLSYQWYSNTTNANTGGTLINGATTATFAIPAELTAGGNYYYYVIVSATGGATSVTSNAVKVTVNAAGDTGPDCDCPSGEKCCVCDSANCCDKNDCDDCCEDTGICCEHGTCECLD
jgi:hypothetical protein